MSERRSVIAAGMLALLGTRLARAQDKTTLVLATASPGGQAATAAAPIEPAATALYGMSALVGSVAAF